MIKTFIATGFTCLAIGSIAGYFISELTRQPQNLQAQTAAPSQVPAISKSTRKELEDRYIKALSGYRLTIDKKELNIFTDRQLNDEVYRLESSLKAGKPYTPPD
jgi:hypothetical protein